MITVGWLFEKYSPSAKAQIKTFKKRNDYLGISNVMSKEGRRVSGFAAGADPSMVPTKHRTQMMRFGNAAIGGATNMIRRARKELEPKTLKVKPYKGIERRKTNMPRITKSAA